MTREEETPGPVRQGAKTMWTEEHAKRLAICIKTGEMNETTQPMLIAARDELTRLAAENSSLLALLRECRWGTNGECPVCEEYVCEGNCNHQPNCRLAAALKPKEAT